LGARGTVRNGTFSFFTTALIGLNFEKYINENLIQNFFGEILGVIQFCITDA
jgi:hypothetical protein